jgi:uncharacterized RmlC-like cupin family protein
MPKVDRGWVVLPVERMGLKTMPQGHPGLPGICRETAGTTQLAATIVMLPPGGLAHSHTHAEHESIILILEGHCVAFMGPRCEELLLRAGDFLFIPAGVPHMPVNLSLAHRFVALTARGDPNIVERLILAPDIEEICLARVPDLRRRFQAHDLSIDWDEAAYLDEMPFRFPEFALAGHVRS